MALLCLSRNPSVVGPTSLHVMIRPPEPSPLASARAQTRIVIVAWSKPLVVVCSSFEFRPSNAIPAMSDTRQEGIARPEPGHTDRLRGGNGRQFAVRVEVLPVLVHRRVGNPERVFRDEVGEGHPGGGRCPRSAGHTSELQS